MIACGCVTSLFLMMVAGIVAIFIGEVAEEVNKNMIMKRKRQSKVKRSASAEQRDTLSEWRRILNG